MSRWKQHLFAAPGIAVSLLPSFTCPICASASIGILSAFGFGYLLSKAYLLPVTAVLLAIALAGLGFRAHKRRGYGPLMLGAMAAAAVLLGKFTWDLSVMTYAGVGLLVVGSFWNAWPRRASEPACPACIENHSH